MVVIVGVIIEFVLSYFYFLIAIPISDKEEETLTGNKLVLLRKLTPILKFLPVTKVSPWLEISKVISEVTL